MWQKLALKRASKTEEQFLGDDGKCKMLRMKVKRDPTHSRQLGTQHEFLSESLLVCIPGSLNTSYPVWAVLGHPTFMY